MRFPLAAALVVLLACGPASAHGGNAPCKPRRPADGKAPVCEKPGAEEDNDPLEKLLKGLGMDPGSPYSEGWDLPGSIRPPGSVLPGPLPEVGPAPEGRETWRKVRPLKGPRLVDTWQYPLDKRWPVSSPYGNRMISRDGAPARKEFHPGVDLAVYAYTPIYAARPGRVLFAGEVRGFGLAVVMEHAGGLRSIYGHLMEVHVKSGQKIDKRGSLGLTGDTGSSQGAHLHFEIRDKKNRPVDPHALIGVPRTSPTLLARKTSPRPAAKAAPVRARSGSSKAPVRR